MQDWSPDVDLPNYLLKAREYTYDNLSIFKSEYQMWIIC